MNNRFSLLYAAVLMCFGGNVSAAPQMLPGGDPVVPCVPPAIRLQLEDWRSKNYPRPKGFYPEVLRTITCILKASPLVRDENGFRVLQLKTSRDEAVFSAIGLGGIGPHWVSMKLETTALNMQGMVYMGGGIKGDCTWTYEDVFDSFKRMLGKVDCVDAKTKMEIEFVDAFRWLQGSFYGLLEDVLLEAIRIHEGRYQER